jgi:microcin C transport system substrate-binding protein
MDQPLRKTVQNCRMRGLIVGMLFGACFPAWSAHAYAQFGDIKYPPGFQHFDYVNPKAPKGGEISLVPPTRLSNFDKYNPFTLKGSAPPSLVGLVFETLLTGTLDEPTTAYGLLAEDVAVAPDRLSVVFRLHPAARFSNGDPVLATDVKHSFDRLVSKESAPQYRTIFGEVRGATILGERIIRFDFKRVNAELPLIVGGLPVFSRQWGMEKGKAKPLDQIVTDMPIGSGPYRVGKVSFGRDITYERDPHYWAKDLNVRRGLFNFDRITYKIYKDNTAQLEAFKAGEFDYIQAFIAREWARAYSGKQFDSGQLIKKELKHGNAGDFQGFQFNTRRDKFKDPRVREAIGLAMDFEWLNRQLFYNAYTRVRGYFVASDFEATGKPGSDELALLEPSAGPVAARGLHAGRPAAARHQPRPSFRAHAARQPAPRPRAVGRGGLDLSRRRASKCQGRSVHHRIPGQLRLDGSHRDPFCPGIWRSWASPSTTRSSTSRSCKSAWTCLTSK